MSTPFSFLEAANWAAPIPNPSAPMKRLVARDRPFYQSSNSLRIRHQMAKGIKHRTWWIEDWFHVFLRLRSVVSFFVLVMIWTCGMLMFTILYMLVDRRQPNVACGLGKAGEPINIDAAFAFSLETSTTVGYGLPNGGNGFFESQCGELQGVIYFQMLFSMIFNAFLLSFVYSRISRSESRGAQVLFSRKAVLNRVLLPNGIKRYMFSARIYDGDSMYPLVEAHARFYAVKHGTMHAALVPSRWPLKMEPMRVSVPNDDLGAVLYTSIPSQATHHIDYHSPILPPSKQTLGPEDGRVCGDSGFVIDPSGLNLRENDSYTGSQDGLRCVICGETYGTVSNLIQHIRYNQHLENHDGVPVRGSHQELDVNTIFKRGLQSQSGHGNSEAGDSTDRNSSCDVINKPLLPQWYDEHRRYLTQANIEIICVIEAIDPMTSGTFQAIQSYTVDDIVFGDVDFAPCVMTDRDVGPKGHAWLKRLLLGRGALGRSVKIDLDAFHDIVEIREP